MMVNRLHWHSLRMMRHALLASVAATVLVAAGPGQAEFIGDLETAVEAAAGLEAASPEAASADRETELSVAPLDLAPLDLSPPPEAPQLLDQVPLDAAVRVANRRLVIRLDQRRVYVYEGETTLVSYPIAVGRRGWETPKGEFEVFQMIEDPSWQHPWNGSIVPPGPDNPLGRRWIGFWTDGVNAIGFHGTPNESLVGQAVSHGCIRMKNADVQNLFAMVGNGTTVTVE